MPGLDFSMTTTKKEPIQKFPYLEPQVVCLINEQLNLLSTLQNTFDVFHHNVLHFIDFFLDRSNLGQLLRVLFTVIHPVLEPRTAQAAKQGGYDVCQE